MNYHHTVNCIKIIRKKHWLLFDLTCLFRLLSILPIWLFLLMSSYSFSSNSHFDILFGFHSPFPLKPQLIISSHLSHIVLYSVSCFTFIFLPLCQLFLYNLPYFPRFPRTVYAFPSANTCLCSFPRNIKLSHPLDSKLLHLLPFE